MYQLLVRLMMIAALVELGGSFMLGECNNPRQCMIEFHRASMQVLKIDWKPISVWQEERIPVKPK